MRTRRVGRLHAWMTVAFGALALLAGRDADAQITANGKTLTVTTTNAVATFNGPDLVGFVNSVTNESYLKNPSNGDLVQVDAIVSTGHALQSSNWSVGVEAGTGAPIATINSRDSARTFTLTVKIDSASQEIVLNSSASVTSGGARGAAWAMAGLDLTNGRWIVPAKSGVVFDRDHPGLNTYLEYPFSWHAQMAVYEAPLGSFLLYSTDAAYSFKQLRQTSRADDTLDVAVFTEAEAPWLSASSVPAVEWRLKAYAGDWRVAAQPFRDWMLTSRPPVSNAAHLWVTNIRTVVGVSSGNQDPSLLAPLAAQVNASQTLIYLIDWRQNGYDINYPDYTPAAGTAAFISAAHALGFKVMLHTDLVGVAPTNGDYAGVQAFQTRTSETLQPMGWNWDKPPSTPQRYAIINPAAVAFRSLWIARIGAAIAAVNPDALHLDFNGIYNDGSGRIGGLTFPQGDVQFHSEIASAFPTIALGGELQSDIDYRFYSFAQAGLDMAFVPALGHPIVTFLFSPQTLTYGHLSTPSVTGGGVDLPSLTNGRFKAALIEDQRRAVFPLWHVDSTNDLDASDPDIARFIGIARNWQNDALAPSWTSDWTGALIRYQGSGGTTAALTDTGNLLSLATPQSAIFQIAHGADQFTTGSFIDRWPAFDGSTLYGLDPAKVYFLDPLPRSVATHATSLASGIQIGTGTRVSTSFAHIELQRAAPFDFDDPTFPHAHTGVRYQGTDYPLTNGAVVNRQNTTVGGETRAGIFVHPPWQAQIGGETFIEYAVPVAANATLRFSVGIDDGAACTDGVTFRVTAGGAEIWRENVDRGSWHDVVVNLAAFAGTTIPLRLISNPGPVPNANCDWSSWTNVALFAPNPSVSIPMTLVSGSAFSGIDGATYTPTSSSSGIVTSAAAPGAFTIFTQPGPAVGAGSNLATVPFEIWRGGSGELARPGTIFGSGTVGPQTAGGVVRSPAIFAHPPSPGRTVLSWVVRLPATPLQLGWSAGVMDGAASSDGVDFEVRINGQPYWRLTDGAGGTNRWTSASLNLSRWSGRSILLELTTDSRGDNSFDWAAWADLLLTPSSISCTYGVPAAASLGPIGGSFSANVTAPATCPWSASSDASWISVTSGSGNGNGAVMYAVLPNAGGRRTGTLTVGGQTVTITQDGSPATMALDRSSLTFTAVNNGTGFVTVTAPQTIRMTQTGSATLTWSIGALPSWLQVSPTSGTGSATLTFTARFAPGLLATQGGSIPVTLIGAGNSVGPVAVTLKSISPSAVAAPFGSFDTPASGSTGVAGSVAVTGWALDDVQVMRVTICRDAVSGETGFNFANCGGGAKIYIGDVSFVDGARPDVAAANPDAPMNTRAGWGYLLLTNFLPGFGNGVFRLSAYADDVDGHSTLLGTKTITCTNGSSTLPFGAIDTPGQGQTISGLVNNFGWVLSPGTRLADPLHGGTVLVVIDGAVVGSPSGWVSRPDLSALFPVAQFSGINNALGVYTFDSTTLTNGVHTIAWVVTDNQGGAAGIGSRYFTVSNGAGLRVGSEMAALGPPSFFTTLVEGRHGPDLRAPYKPLAVTGDGVLIVRAEELELIDVRIGATGGVLRTAAGDRPLPIGSHIDRRDGTFRWQPGPGFVGAYNLRFDTAQGPRDVRVTLHAQGTLSRPQVVIDSPTADSRTEGAFTISGWAFDPSATIGSGIDAIHIWAYPASGGPPVFLGATLPLGTRSDVAAFYGDAARRSGFDLTISTLPSGTYTLAVFAWSTDQHGFLPAKTVLITVR